MSIQAVSRGWATERLAAWAPYAVIVALLTAELVAVLLLNGGMFVYTLDDAYIHLAMAENIARGHYGVNLSEYSAPSSSILWPFLLVPFAGTAVHDEWPLVLNVASALATIAVLQAILQRVIPPPAARFDWLRPAVIALALIVFNIVGLVFTGLEHSLQVLLALLIALGLIVEAEDRSVPWFLAVAVVLGPLVRYENLAVSAGAIVYLGIRGRPAMALALGALTLAPLAAFSMFLHGIGLDWLPSSVLMKSQLPAADPTWHSSLRALSQSVVQSFNSHLGLMLLASALLFGWRLWRPTGSGGGRALALAGLVMVAAHIIGGRYSWFVRYEIYVMTSAAALLVYLWRDDLSGRLRRHSFFAAWAVMILAAALIARRTMVPTLLTPLAAHNIYDQQYQMHRFVVDYAGAAPVAVNDLGWVSYRNDGYVLDLWGLASAEAMARRRAREPGWVGHMAARRGVRLAILYDSWFPGQIPATWRRLGTLQFADVAVTSSFADVAFYATDPATAPQFTRLLERFGRSLPPGVRFKMGPAR